MYKKLLIIIIYILPLCANAQTAVSILDNATSSLKKIKCLKSRYTLKLTENGKTTSHTGCIIMQGNKYVNYINGTTIWFNGKIMWTLVESNDEVTITQPSLSELSNSNPYHFLNSYKVDFNSKLIHSTGNIYIIQLIPQKPNNELKKIIISISKTNFQPTKIELHTNKSTISISIKTYESIRPYNSKTFTFNKKHYPDVEIIDLR